MTAPLPVPPADRPILNGVLPRFMHAVTRRPSASFARGLTSRAHLGAPSYEQTQAAFDAYVEALRATGLGVTVLEPVEQFPDAHFVEDSAVLFCDTAFVCRPANPARRGEEHAMAPTLSGFRRVYAEGDATLEGGDVLFCHDRVLIGLSKRTNRVGAEQLRRAILERLPGTRVEFVPFTGVLHLKTGLTELAPGLLVHDPQMRLETSLSGLNIVTLPAQEGYSASVLPVNQHILIADGFPTVAELAAQHYNEVIALPMGEIEKMDGGLTCLSLRY
ncbi:MAG: arginine deiminase family protein [Anaerolineae bacterium]|nr:arginine deiminase family protein [Anaerolineae bacterium]